MGKRIFHVLLIIVVGFLVYSNTFNAPFHFDDNSNIIENYKLRDLSNFWPPSGSRWFGYLTFALNYYFGGLNVAGYHIVNIAIHVLNAILVYLLVVFTFRTPYFSTSNPPLPPFSKGGMVATGDSPRRGGFALFSALLFVAHPIQTQAVTYIVQRFTSLAAFFYLLSLVMYIKARLLRQGVGVRGQGVGTAKNYTLLPTRYALYAVSLVSAILAMKTKEISFTLPVIIALYEFMFFGNNQFVIPVKTGIQDKDELDSLLGESSEATCLRRNDRMESGYRRLLYLIPFLLTLLIIPFSLMGTDKPIGDAIGELREAAQETEEIPRWSYLFTQFRVIVTYIRLLFFPINQNLDYDYPLYHSYLNPEVFLSLLFLLLIFAFAVYLLYSTRYTLHPTPHPLHHTRFLSFGIFWFFITLSVESSIIPIRDVIFEHRLYLPVIGIIIVFVSATVYILQAMIPNPKRSLATHYLLLATAVIVLSIATYGRNIIWQDEVSLWEDVVKKSPNKARGHNNTGFLYDDNGLADKAIEEYQIAIRLKPNYADAHNNLGLAYYNKGLIDTAIEEYQVAIRLKPNYIEAYYNLGNAYKKKGLTDMAIEYYQIALRINPDYVKAHVNIANAYDDKGMTDKAIEHLQIALRLKPDYADAHNNLGIIYGTMGSFDKAIEHLQIALRLKPDYVDAYTNLGSAYAKKGMLDEAIRQYRIALRFNPKHEIARDNLNRILQIQRSK